MKRSEILVMLFTAAFTCLIASCSEDVPEPVFTIKPTSLPEIESSGGEFTFEVETNLDNWTVEVPDNVDWLTATSDKAGSKASVKVQANPVTEPRSAKLVFKGATIAIDLEVTQKARKEGDPFLTFDPTLLSVEAMGGEFPVEVNTNFDEWTVDVPEEIDWLTTSSDKENRIETIKVQENTKREPRTAILVFKAGSVIANYTVTQMMSDSEPFITLNPLSLETESEGGEFTIKVSTNLDDWTIEVPEWCNWIEATQKIETGEVLVKLPENTTGFPLSGVIYFASVSGEIDVEYEVVVQHKKADNFGLVLPYLKFEAGVDDVRRYEEGRGYKLLREPSADYPVLSYGLGNEFFYQVDYYFAEDHYVYADMLVTVDGYYDDDDKLRQAIIDAGFKVKKDEYSEMEYENEEGTIEVIYIFGNPFVENCVRFKYIPKQPQLFKTFDVFPYGLTEFGQADVERIKTWENENGGTFNEKNSGLVDADFSIYRYFFDVNKGDLLSRFYFVVDMDESNPNYDEELNGLLQTAKFYTEQSLVYWNYRGELRITDEFAALMEQEGFTEYGRDMNGTDFFIKPGEFRVLVSIERYGGNEVLAIYLEPSR